MFDSHPLTPQPQPGSQLYFGFKDKGGIAELTPFSYTMLQKVQPTQPTPTVAEDKTGYRFDVTQPFSYNYALVNQMSLAAAASSASFKCDVCGLAFSHLSLLNHHKRIHTNQAAERLFPCEHCGSAFNELSELKAHKQSEHKTVSRSCTVCGVEVDCEQTKKKSKNFRCANCTGQRVTSGYESTQVGTDDATKGKKKIASIAKCYKCNGSGILFIHGQNEVEKPFHCNVCDSSFSRYSSLWSHRRLHSGDKPFKCELCGMTFARAAYLKNHGRVHSGERPYKCNVCGMQFSQSPHLKNHERIHSGERPYECEICNKTFARHSTLWNHRRIHTGEKPYRCDICGTAFNQATHLKNHAKVHTGEKPHRCDICGVGFSDRFALKRHRATHEKYGQTAPSSNSGSQIDDDIYKCSMVKPNQISPPQVDDLYSNSQQQRDDNYNCNVVAGGIAFPGCSRPQEAK